MAVPAVDEEKQPEGAVPPPSGGAESGLERNPEVEQFFQRLMEKNDMKRPKPSDEAIAAALQAIQRLGTIGTIGNAEVEAPPEDRPEPAALGALTCRQCGYRNQVGNQFCGMCGVRFSEDAMEQALPGKAPGGSVQHQYHHHEHHHYFHSSQDGDVLTAALRQRAPVTTAAKDAVRLRAPAGGGALTKAEATIRQLTQDWALACNNKQLDDMLALYATDALVLRPNVPPVRGTAAIREFFFSALEAGLGDVEMETLRVELFGDIAYETGRCKMLVPVAMGKRREERGKYVIIYAKQKSGDWQTIVDSWSSDLSLNVGSESPAKASQPQSAPSKLRR
jgi:uncharacterized protein (TIGR02246 family)